jgi:hypothetical protein
LGIVLLVTVALVLVVGLIYVSSMMRFVLFDSIITRECHIRRFWIARRGPGFRYFLWQLLFTCATTAGLLSLVVTALSLAFGFGWLRNPREHLFPLILGGIVFAGVFATLLILTLVVYVLAKDFVVPQMAFENIGAIDGWSRLLPMMQEEKLAYTGYVGLKILLALGGAIALLIASLVVFLIWLIPFGSLGLVLFLVAKAAGLGWNVFTIFICVLLAVIALAVLIYAVALATVPLIVFFPAYSIYFFAERYEPLKRVV